MFEGVKIEAGPSMPIGTITSVTLCESCLKDEEMRFALRDRPTRLPISVRPEDFRGEWLEPCHVVKDSDPLMECDFFETRQVRPDILLLAGQKGFGLKFAEANLFRLAYLYRLDGC